MSVSPYSSGDFSVHQADQAKIETTANRRITFDKACKCIPIIATINAIVDMVQKSMYEDAPAELLDAYQKRIRSDKTWEQCCLLIPVFGQIVIAISAIVEACSSEALLEEESTEEVVSEEEVVPLNYPKANYDRLSITSRINYSTMYSEALNKLEDGDMDGLAPMTEIAELGDPKAQFELGRYYRSKEDQEKATFWLNQAANNGYDLMRNPAGEDLATEDEVEIPQEEDYPKANYEALAQTKKTVMGMQYSIALAKLERGDVQGVPPMVNMAKTGNPEAQCALGIYYLDKVENQEKAKFWLDQAAKNESAEAIATLEAHPEISDII